MIERQLLHSDSGQIPEDAERRQTDEREPGPSPSCGEGLGGSKYRSKIKRKPGKNSLTFNFSALFQKDNATRSSCKLSVLLPSMLVIPSFGFSLRFFVLVFRFLLPAPRLRMLLLGLLISLRILSLRLTLWLLNIRLSLLLSLRLLSLVSSTLLLHLFLMSLTFRPLLILSLSLLLHIFLVSLTFRPLLMFPLSLLLHIFLVSLNFRPLLIFSLSLHSYFLPLLMLSRLIGLDAPVIVPFPMSIIMPIFPVVLKLSIRNPFIVPRVSVPIMGSVVFSPPWVYIVIKARDTVIISPIPIIIM